MKRGALRKLCAALLLIRRGKKIRRGFTLRRLGLYFFLPAINGSPASARSAAAP